MRYNKYRLDEEDKPLTRLIYKTGTCDVTDLVISICIAARRRGLRLVKWNSGYRYLLALIPKNKEKPISVHTITYPSVKIPRGSGEGKLQKTSRSKTFHILVEFAQREGLYEVVNKFMPMVNKRIIRRKGRVYYVNAQQFSEKDKDWRALLDCERCKECHSSADE